MTKKSSKFTVAIDTREQKPYRFPQAEAKALGVGDYSVVGLEDKVTVERKTKSDAYASLGRGRARFKRELERLSSYDYAAIVIEASLTDFLLQPGFSKMRPKAAVNTLISWSIKYDVHVFFAQDRRHAKALTYRILEKYHRHATEGEKRAARSS